MKFVTIAGTSSAHGVSTAPGTDITTTVLGCAAAMAETIAEIDIFAFTPRIASRYDAVSMHGLDQR